MQTLHTVLKRGVLFWDQDLLPPPVFETRLRDIQQAIAAAGDDAWVIYGDAQKYGSVAYATHFLPRTRSAMAVVPREGSPSLLASVGSRDIPAAKTLTFVEDVRPFTALPKEAVRLVQDHGLENARIGLVGARDSLPVVEWTAIADALPAVEWRHRDAELQALRARKSRTEVGAIAHTAGLVGNGLERARAALRPGISVRAAMADVDREIRRRGAEDVRILVASGDQVGRALRPPDDRLLAAGDTVLLFVAAEYQRYWAEGAQTFTLGAPDGAVRALAETAAETVAAMRAAAVAPGARASDVAEAAHQRLGTGEALAAAEAYGLGHGIGLDLEESPTIAADEATAIQDGATLGLHVVLHAGGRGAIFGQTIGVAAGSATPLLPLAALVEC